jgi:hypothetical protein
MARERSLELSDKVADPLPAPGMLAFSPFSELAGGQDGVEKVAGDLTGNGLKRVYSILVTALAQRRRCAFHRGPHIPE